MQDELNKIEHGINMALSALSIEVIDEAKNILLGTLRYVYLAQKEASEKDSKTFIRCAQCDHLVPSDTFDKSN